MITQKELNRVVRLRKQLAAYEEKPDVIDYLGFDTEVKAVLADLRERRQRGEGVEPGRLCLTEKLSVAVAWQKVCMALSGLRSISGAIERDPKARFILEQAARPKDHPDAPFVTPRISLDVVSAE